MWLSLFGSYAVLLDKEDGQYLLGVSQLKSTRIEDVRAAVIEAIKDLKEIEETNGRNTTITQESGFVKW